MNIQAIKGVKDILPADMPRWDFVEKCLRSLFKSFNFREIKIPIFEETLLFARSIGAGTDIVEKEMYTFEDRDGKKLTLRPEGTASVVRAFIEHNLNSFAPLTKVFYIGPMFRHERPQKGRFRQFYQAGAEVLGPSGPLQDVEIISFVTQFFEKTGLSVDPTLVLEINSVGCPACRPNYKKVLQDFLTGIANELCDNCKRRTNTNPMRVLDCKSESCQKALAGAPDILKYLCGECAGHFDEVQKGLSLLKIRFLINSRLVRGLDYYTKTAFEWKSGNLGAQNTLAAGGRYDGLVEELGGPKVPGIGFALGMERVISLLDPSKGIPEGIDLYIAALGGPAQKTALPLLSKLRALEISAEMDVIGASLKSQMKKADRLHAKYVLILGEAELAAGKAFFRDMKTKAQEEFPLQDMESTLIKKFHVS
ncbi:MAG TPA: histidine--tRNA ligase [Nitrospiria bacterium]|nr:histidine--tRNA ligase [Nitrospiria bacterium]